MGLFGRKVDPTYALDVDFDFQDTSARAYLKRVALDAGVNFIARRFAQSKFKHKKGDKYVNDDALKLLNKRPNRNETATQFWEHVIYNLIYEGECLIVINDSKEMLIAESFVHTKYANYDDTFSGVYVRGFRFERTFSMSDVIYLNYQNERLESYTDSLFCDYGKMLGRMVDIQMRNNQIRGILKADLQQGTQEKKQEQLNNFLGKIFNAFKQKDVAVVPLTNGFDYEEIGGTKSNTQQQFEQIKALRKDALATVADILGIPEPLIVDTPADASKAEETFNSGTLAFFYQLVLDELNSKLSKSDDDIFLISGKNQKDIFSLAEPIDKLVSSGVMTRNEIRELLGLEKSQDSDLDKFYITKNYEQSSKGGENDGESS